MTTIQTIKPYKIKDNQIVNGWIIPDKMWFFYFKKFTFFKGFVFRIFGVHFITTFKGHNVPINVLIGQF